MSGEILVVEDNDKNLKLVRDLLQLNGYRTLEAMTAAEGIALAVEHCPALVLLDVQLPDMDGREALRRLRSDPRTASIAVVAVLRLATTRMVSPVAAFAIVAVCASGAPASVAEFKSISASVLVFCARRMKTLDGVT